MSSDPHESLAVRLAAEADFRLGRLQVSPSRLSASGRSGDIIHLEPRVMGVLVILARAQGRTVTRDELIEACWGGRIVTDNAVSRAVTQLRTLERAEPGAFRLETVRKVGFRLLVGDAVPDAPDATAAVARRNWFRAAPMVTVLVVVLAAVGALLGFRDRSAARWIVVAPPSVSRSDSGVEQLGAGLEEALLISLAAAGDHDLDPDRNGKARLQLATSVAREAQRFVIRAKLVDSSSGNLLWSKRYEGPVDLAVGFEETTAAQVSAVSVCARQHARRYAGKMSNRLLSLVLRACSACRDGDAAAALAATSDLVSEAPGYSGAHSMRAVALSDAWRQAQASGASGPSLESIRWEARRALELDPDNPEAHVVLGSRVGRDLFARESHLRRALSIAPDDTTASLEYAWFLQQTGRLKDAAQAASQSAALDPLNAAALGRKAWLEAVIGERISAQATLRRLELVDPQGAGEAGLVIAFWHEERPAALRRFQAARARGETDDDCMLAMLSRRRDASLPKVCGTLQGDWAARLQASAGEIDAAYSAATAYARRADHQTVFLFYPEMAGFRRDPRFMGLAHQLGLVTYWLRSGNWPDFCADPDLPYDCQAVARRLYPQA